MTTHSDYDVKAAAKYNSGLRLPTELVRRIQQLVEVAADGVAGPATAEGIARWQAQEGDVSVDGRISAEILEELEESEHELGFEPGEDDEGNGGTAHDPEERPAEFLDLCSVKRTKERGKPKGKPRGWDKIKGITLHQTACVFSGPEHKGVINVPAHAMTFQDGKVALLNPPTSLMYHGNGLNDTDIGIEISCHACGIENVFTRTYKGPGENTFWRCSKAPDRQPSEATEIQLEATKRLVKYYIELVEHHKGNIQFIHAHRQSTGKPADPGSKIWKAVGVWAQKTFDLKTGPMDNWCTGSGSPIPTAWDDRIKGVPYSHNVKRC
jgi:hypothetical protein